MSRTTILVAGADGTLQRGRDFSNSWGGAWFVWDSLWRQYLYDPTQILLDHTQAQRVWALDRDARLSVEEKLVLITTFDLCLIRRQDCEVVAEAFDAFAARYERRRGARACTLPLQALYLREVARTLEVHEIGWQQTSCGDMLWTTADSAYNVRTDTGHWFLFDRYPELRGCLAA